MSICNCTGKCKTPPYTCSGLCTGTLTTSPSFIPETLSLCIHGMPVKFNNCRECANMANDNFSLNNRINALHEHKIRQIDENRKVFKRFEELENETIVPLVEKIDELEDIVDDIEHQGNDHEDRIEKLELKNIDRQITRISELEKFRNDFKDALKKDISENEDMFIEIERRINSLESMADFEKVKSLIFEGAKTHASILRCEKRLKELEEWTRKDEDAIYKRIKIIEDFIGQNYRSDIQRIEKLVNAHEEYLCRIDKIAMCDPDKVLSNQKILDERLSILEAKIDNKSGKVDKIPHKCPKCEGDGKLWELKINGIPADYSKFINCFCCEGKGILWS
jgi:hypothetical protein